MQSHEVVITGIGLVSSLGEGHDAHWQAMSAVKPTPVVDEQGFAPFPVHPLPEIDWSTQIPRKGDLRQMDGWQRLGVHTAGLALADAGIKDDLALCASMDMIVAAGGGARDIAVDEMILAESRRRDDFPSWLNQALATQLRPTLFLAQLSNLMAGNISIVHKVTGSSRTFMGEEGCGYSAIEQAVARIRAGQSSHLIAGGAYFCQTPDFLLVPAMGGLLHRGAWQPLSRRADKDGGGVVLGSGAAFLVLESRAHAEARGAHIHATLASVTKARLRRDAAYGAALADFYRQAGRDEAELVFSGANGRHALAEAETQALAGLPQRAIASLFGHVKEAQFPFALALAALAISHGQAPAPFDPSTDTALATPLARAFVTGIGLVEGEAAATVSRS